MPIVQLIPVNMMNFYTLANSELNDGPDQEIDPLTIPIMDSYIFPVCVHVVSDINCTYYKPVLHFNVN